MKLLHYTYRKLSLLLLLLMAVWGVLFYYAIIDEVMDETDDTLENYSEILINNALMDPSILAEKPKRTGGTKNLQKLLNTLEREISQLETQSSDLEQQMVDAASDSGKLLELMTEKEACDEKLAAKMDEWEAVAAELEELQ